MDSKNQYNVLQSETKQINDFVDDILKADQENQGNNEEKPNKKIIVQAENIVDKEKEGVTGSGSFLRLRVG